MIINFDIIIPTINRASLDRAVESIYAQTYPHWKLYVIGDGVTPDIENYNKEKVFCASIDQHVGDSGASPRNKGIAMGSNPWIMWLDDDDVFLPNALSIVARLAEENPKASLIKTSAQEIRLSRKSPRHKKEIIKLGVVNETDPLTITLAHTRELFYKTRKWQSCDNHDHILFKEMLAAGGILVSSDHITALFMR